VLTHYDVLSVDPTAELETIRRAFRLKVRLLHPDKHRESPHDVQAAAERETLRVNQAWDTLRDADKRHEYDVHLLQLRDVDLEREADDPQDHRRDRDSDREALRLSPYYYLNVASFVIVIVASAFVVAGAMLLATMTQ
jgi:curved DNA-binding protein CbpA